MTAPDARRHARARIDHHAPRMAADIRGKVPHFLANFRFYPSDPGLDLLLALARSRCSVVSFEINEIAVHKRSRIGSRRLFSEMDRPDEAAADSSSEGSAEETPSHPNAGAPPPPPPGPGKKPAPSSSPSASAPLKLKARDQVPFESLRRSEAGEKLFGKGKKWNGPVRWNSSKGEWRPYTPGSHSSSYHSNPLQTPTSITVLTYNVLFATHCMGDQRLAALLPLLRQTNADVMCIAEAVPAFLVALLQSPWVREQYHVADSADASTIERCGCLILSKLPFQQVR